MEFLINFFKISERGSSVRTEIIAGITIFMSMAYILAVNPSILAASGMDQNSVFVATAVSSAIATFLIAVMANLPVALAPAMGTNAFFSYVIVLGLGYSWEEALTAVFLQGILFVLLTLTRLREALLNCMPLDLKYAISCGIGLFIAFIGLTSSELVVNSDATLITLGDLTTPGSIASVFGLIVISLLLYYRVKGALLVGILLTTGLSLLLGVTTLENFNVDQLFSIPSVSPTFWKFDFSNVFSVDMFVIVLTLFLVDIFNTLGALIGVATQGNLLDEEGRLPQAREAFLADALGTIVGAIFGTSTVTSYVESSSGIAEGGRTGLTSLTVAILFLLALFLAPVFLLVPPNATAPALVIVGFFMMSSAKEINYTDVVTAIPSFLIIATMPFTYSIADAIGIGMISYTILGVLSGRAKELHPVLYFICIAFLWDFLQ